MSKKKIILIAIPAIIILFVVFQALKPQPPDFNVETVTRGTVLQEVSESGTIKKGENINLNFKSGGKIENIFVAKGDFVSAGQQLARLNTAQLEIQLAQAKINAQAQLARLLELQRSANSGLAGYYDSTPSILNQAYNLANTAIRQQIASMFVYRVEFTVPRYELTYKNCNTQATQESGNLRKNAESDLNIWRNELESLSGSPVELENALLKAENYLSSFRDLLLKLNDTLTINCQLVTDEKTTIEAYKSVVSTALTSLNSAIASILTQKEAIKAQKLAVQNYSVQENMEITYQEGLVRQAEAGVELLQEQINDAVLRAPTNGQVAMVGKRTGETILATESLLVLLPDSPFQIEVDIYEEDIIKVKIGDFADIELTAFPDMIFSGSVLSTDPAAKLIDGVVYYGVKIDLQNPPEGARSGMSADVTIKTAEKENVIAISGTAIETRDGRYFVQIVKDGATTSEREIETGLEGENNIIEVLSGLQEGEQIAVPK